MATSKTERRSEGGARASGAGYDRILVPLDGTPFAEAALRPAARTAARSGGTLYLATVLPQGTGEALHVEPVTNEPVSEVEHVAIMDQYLETVSNRIRELWDCEVSANMLTPDSPTAALLAHAEDVSADLIVAATHARGAVVRALLGSTANDLVRRAKRPVLLVPSADPEPDEMTTPLQDDITAVVVALDPDGDPDGTALFHAGRFARLWSVPLHLAHVIMKFPLPATNPAGGGPVETEQGVVASADALEDARSELEALASSLRREGVDAYPHALSGFKVVDAIGELVEESEADLLVVGRHDKSLFERMWEGSESDRLTRRVRSAGILVCPLE